MRTTSLHSHAMLVDPVIPRSLTWRTASSKPPAQTTWLAVRPCARGSNRGMRHGMQTCPKWVKMGQSGIICWNVSNTRNCCFCSGLKVINHDMLMYFVGFVGKSWDRRNLQRVFVQHPGNCRRCSVPPASYECDLAPGPVATQQIWSDNSAGYLVKGKN